MENFFCASVFVFSIPILLITLGLIYIFKKDWAWRIAEWMLKAVKPQRTPEWEYYATINGAIMLAGGLLAILFLLSQLFNSR